VPPREEAAGEEAQAGGGGCAPERQLAAARRAARAAIAAALLKALPYGAQLAAAGAAYRLGITAAQIVGLTLRVSCRTPVLGPALGAAGVGFASALAGQAARHARALLAPPPPPPPCADGAARTCRWWRPARVAPEEALLDAALGLLIFKAAGGRFSSVMPSDLAAPGALAFESLPAAGRDYAGSGARRELARIFRRDGCHHCGARRVGRGMSATRARGPARLGVPGSRARGRPAAPATASDHRPPPPPLPCPWPQGPSAGPSSQTTSRPTSCYRRAPAARARSWRRGLATCRSCARWDEEGGRRLLGSRSGGLVSLSGARGP
jgi:hypothetical protein